MFIRSLFQPRATLAVLTCKVVFDLNAGFEASVSNIDQVLSAIRRLQAVKFRSQNLHLLGKDTEHNTRR